MSVSEAVRVFVSAGKTRRRTLHVFGRDFHFKGTAAGDAQICLMKLMMPNVIDCVKHICLDIYQHCAVSFLSTMKIRCVFQSTASFLQSHTLRDFSAFAFIA